MKRPLFQLDEEPWAKLGMKEGQDGGETRELIDTLDTPQWVSHEKEDRSI